VTETILAIDIGSTKICAIIAEIENERIQIIGHGIAKSQGVKKGNITNIEQASKSIRKALGDARRIAGSNISTATVSISNTYAKSIGSSGIVNIPSSNRDISIKEINRVMQTALYNADIPNDYSVLHVLPYNFKVDEQSFIDDPYGMNANRLEVDVNIIVAQKSSISNLQKAIRGAGVEVENIVVSGYASLISTATEDEKELNVAVIDIGGQTSNLVIHAGSSIKYNDFLGVGSNHITNDLSMALHTPIQVAENVKLRHANLIEPSQEHIDLPIIGDEQNTNSVSLETVYSVVISRVEETLLLLRKSIDNSKLRDQLGGGIVLTGGMTKLKGIRELAQVIFDGMPVRVAFPSKVSGLFNELKDPSFSTVVGLLLYKSGYNTEYEINITHELLHSKSSSECLIQDSSPQLSDIKLNEVVADTRRDSSIGHHETKVTDKNIGFSLDELSTTSMEETNPFKKFINWAKQLF
jgi:cell division protein FtsA